MSHGTLFPWNRSLEQGECLPTLPTFSFLASRNRPRGPVRTVLSLTRSHLVDNVFPQACGVIIELGVETPEALLVVLIIDQGSTPESNSPGLLSHRIL